MPKPVSTASQRGISSHLRFLAPPIRELILSVGFQPLPFTVVQFGGLWAAFKERFPNVEQKPPYKLQIETFGQPPGPTITLELVDVALPRLWLIDNAGSQLVQIQNDWFARNWRRVDDQEGYPRYPALSDAFVADLTKFQSYLASEGIGGLVPTQCEITYVDHIELPDGEADLPLSSILSVVSDPPASFDLPPDGQGIALNYLLSNEGASVGRLHVTVNTAVRRSDGKAIAVLNSTARGLPIGEGIEGVVAFQDLGREWAWKAFIGLIREDVQQSWKEAS
ncbi:MAG: hypothetical protein QOJ81_222 [Chloroflexota bacterium]|jgi:uncharacterized protein (TIGR04255 family)|nr:hypothetical protein [Chloroflexota bacterium]